MVLLVTFDKRTQFIVIKKQTIMQSGITFVTVLLLVSLWACDPSQSEPPSSGEGITPIAQPCDLTPFSGYEIEKDTAIAAIEQYQGYIDSVAILLNRMPQRYPDTDDKLIHGVQVERGELLDILKACPKDSLYIMIGTKSSGETEFFFAFESKSDKVDVSSWHFYDFTQPCPTACPDFR